METIHISNDREMDFIKSCGIYIYTHNGILHTAKKDGIMHLAETWWDLKDIRLSKESYRKTDKYWRISPIYWRERKKKQGKRYHRMIISGELVRTQRKIQVEIESVEVI